MYRGPTRASRLIKKLKKIALAYPGFVSASASDRIFLGGSLTTDAVAVCEALSRIAIADVLRPRVSRRRVNGRPDPRRRYDDNKEEKKEVCIRKPPSWLSRLGDAGAATKRVGLAPDFRGGGLQARVGRVNVTPVDFARRSAQFAVKRTIETFGLLDIALDRADFAARGANLFEVAAELLEQRIEMAELFFDVADIRMTAVKLM
jgi:hypothetical protein